MNIRQRSIAKMIVMLGLVAFLLDGCVEPTEDEHTGWIDRSELGELTAAPGILEFAPSEIGSDLHERVEITNVGTGAVEITRIELREDHDSSPDLDGRREFFEGEYGWSEAGVNLAPGESHAVSVRYTRRNTGRDLGRILFFTRNTVAEAFEIPIVASRAAPDIDAPRQVAFGRVPPRPDDPGWRGEHRLIEVRNVGQAALRFEDVYVAGSDRFSVSFPAADAPDDPQYDTDSGPDVLAPGHNATVRVWFQPDDNLPERAELVFETNDPDEGLFAVELTTLGQEPCLDVSPREEIDFGRVPIGERSRRSVVLQNCSRTQPLEISDIRLADDADGAYTLDRSELESTPVVLAPEERRRVEVVLEPVVVQPYIGELVISSDDVARPELRQPIIARGSECPLRAKAIAMVQGTSRAQTTIETIPLNTIIFDGSGSTSQYSEIVRYEWTILSRPQGSTQRLLPDSTSVKPRLFLDLVGTYEIELTVSDDSGQQSCDQQAIVTIHAVPDDDVHIQLVWDTPDDPDQTDTFGTDIDLHYLHPDGRWDESPWDIFWRNPSEDWGVQGDNYDDPSLDIDDTDGAGPENINHSGLEDLAYRVGAYYYSDAGLGPSYATVRIYVRGALELQRAHHHMPRTGAFWDVALIHGRSLSVDPVDRMHEGFPGSP